MVVSCAETEEKDGRHTLRRWELALLLGVALAALAGGALGAEQSALADKVIRLHVIANSDDPADQALKLQVRDRILSEAGDLFEQGLTREEAEAAITARLGDLAAAGAETVGRPGTTTRSPPPWKRTCGFPPRSMRTSPCPPGVHRPAHRHRRGRRTELVVRGVSAPVPGLGFRDHGGDRRFGRVQRGRNIPHHRRKRGVCGQIQGHGAVGPVLCLGGEPIKQLRQRRSIALPLLFAL